MVKSIDNFLTQEEQKMISDFMKLSEKRFRSVNSTTLTRPPPLDTEPLNKLLKKKCQRWNTLLKGAIYPNTGISYREAIEKNNINCAIKNFLITFKDIINKEIHHEEHQRILQVLKNELSTCTVSCPCPANNKSV